eukprot:COSAG01_NODE_2347_length_7858_cov_6.577007_2_plen_180_part_00
MRGCSSQALPEARLRGWLLAAGGRGGAAGFEYAPVLGLSLRLSENEDSAACCNSDRRFLSRCLLICARLPQALAQLRQLPLRATRDGHPGAASLDSGVRGAGASGSGVLLSASRMRGASGGAKLKAIVGGQERRGGARGDFDDAVSLKVIGGLHPLLEVDAQHVCCDRCGACPPHHPPG